MEKIVTYNLSDDFIEKIADFIEENFLNEKKDLSRLAIVFGGKRPSLFLKRELSRRIKKSFFSPAFFSMDEFVEYSLVKDKSIRKISDIDACYIIYTLVKKNAPEILKGREDFSRFLPWAREILSFIERLDLEDIEARSLEDIKANAAIGYDVPESINVLLKHIISIRDAYHALLKNKGLYSRGLMYLTASRKAGEAEFNEFDNILFCNFFYLHRTEEKIIKHLHNSSRAILIFQGSKKDWPVFEKNSKNFSCDIEPKGKTTPQYNLSIYSGFDMHSEVCLAREILRGIKNFDNTVIVLPDPDILIPLVSEIASFVKEFNVSMGYPLKRSSLYILFESIWRAQATRKGEGYYTKDYLKLLSHPFIKNLKLRNSPRSREPKKEPDEQRGLPDDRDPSITRVLIHKIEEVLAGIEETKLSGNLFVKLKDIEDLRDLYILTAATLKNMGIEVESRELEKTLKEIHNLLFYPWEKVDNFRDFSDALETFLEALVDKSPLGDYPMNLKIMEKLLILKEEFYNSAFNNEVFLNEDIFKIFQHTLENELIPFHGSPLKGLQILGLFETRSLSFENVIILDVNEGALPMLKVYEPLIPREALAGLGLNRLEEEEEIQRYQFTRLISSAKNVFLVYDASEEKEKSRFIEELIWEREKESQKLGVVPVERGSFHVSVLPEKAEIGKGKDILNFLKGQRFSPSSINTYLYCPRMFYYQYVLGLRDRDDFFEEPEGLHIGKFIHELLEETFKRFEGRVPLIDKEFKDSFFKIFSYRFDDFFVKRMKGDAFLLREVMRFRLEKFLDREEEREVEEVVCLEREFESEIEMETGLIKFTSRIDRIDKYKDKSLFIIDYKTGGDALIPKGIKRLEKMELTRESIKDTVRSFQLPLYLYLARKTYKGCHIMSGLYYLKDLEIDTFPKEKESDSLEHALDVCMKALEFIIGEILNPEAKFTPDEDPRRCKNCPFFYMCR